MERGRFGKGRGWKKGRRSGKNYQRNFSQPELNTSGNPEQQFDFMYRSFSGGQEIDRNQSLYDQRINAGRRNCRQDKMSQFNANLRGNRFEINKPGNSSEFPDRNVLQLNSDYHPSPNINYSQEPCHSLHQTVGAHSSAILSNSEDVSNGDNDEVNHHSTVPADFMEAKRNYEHFLKNLKPLDIILKYRHQIEEVVQNSVKRNLCAINQISDWDNQNNNTDIKNLHSKNLHLQRQEFEEFVSKMKEKLSSLLTLDCYTIPIHADSILNDVKNESKLFERFLPGYSLKSIVLNKLQENQILIISTDSSYYLNVVLPIFLKKKYSDHLLYSCETNELLRSNLKINVNNCFPKVSEECTTSNKSEINFLTDSEMLNILLKDNPADNFITICNLPMKRSIVMDLLLSNLRDSLESQSDSKLILLLTSYDNTLKYEHYFSDFVVDVISTPSLSFPVTTIWKNVPLLPIDDYIEDIVKTVVSIHILDEEGDIMVFLPSVNDAKSGFVSLIKRLPEFHINDVECVLLHENSPNQDWLNMSYKKKLLRRTIFFVTDCAEMFVIPTVRYVIDSGLKQEYIFDSNKKIDILTTSFISCNKAKLRKKLAGLFCDGKCYRLYNKYNFREDMPADEYPEILTINPFNAMIRLFEYQPGAATSVTFVESLSESAKTRALNLLRKCNAIIENKLTPLGERIIKLPFPPLYSKLILLGIEWEIAYEITIIVAFLLIKGKVFQFFNELELQRKVDAVKMQFLQSDSDTLTYLYIYRKWLENNETSSWCSEHFINFEILKSVKEKVNEICEIVGNCVKRNIEPVFSSVEDSSSIRELLFECFKENLCVYTGHYRSGYRMLSSRCISFLHPSTVMCQTENVPQFIIFDHLVSTKRDFLVHITSIPNDMVMTALTNDSLDFDYSDMFEQSLVQRVIEPVGERMINEVLLGKRGHKLKEIEHKIKRKLGNESLVIEPSCEKGRVLVFALESSVDKAVQEVKDILKSQFEAMLNLEKTYILELRKDQVTIPIELTCLKGAKVESTRMVHHKASNIDNKLKSAKDSDAIPYSIKKSIHLNWIRRKCTGEAIVTFLPEFFTLAKRLSMRYISLFGTKVFVTTSEEYRETNLILSGVPEDADKNKIETGLRNILGNIAFETVILKYASPFDTSPNQLQDIKEKIEDECRKSTELVDFNVIVPMCKPTATKMKTYINVSEDENVEQASENLSKNLKTFLGLTTIPVYSSVIKCSLKMCEALTPLFEEKLNELEKDVKSKFPSLEQPFKFDIIPIVKSMPSIKISSNRIEILQVLQRTIFHLLEGEVLTKNFNKDISKMFCHGGYVWLRTLENTSGVHIIDDYRNKSIRLYGSKEKCHFVKKRLLKFLLDAENEAVKTIPLATEGNNRLLLKTLLIEYGVNLENFISTCQLRSAVLDIKSCCLSCHGSYESIGKAETILKSLASNIDLSNFIDVLGNEETCPVCFQRASTLTYRLEMCGHLYCCECIQALVDQAQFPIQCCYADCNQDIILDDINKILGDDPEKINILLEKSLKSYTTEHQADICYCPTPDCSMFFYKKDIPDSKHNCPLCLNDICIKCNVVYHQGFSCDLYQGSKNDPDYSFKVWKKNSEECKQCPKCGTAIQKDGGCDHMTCGTCKSHFCWICVQEFPNAEAVYHHIPYCPMHPRW